MRKKLLVIFIFACVGSVAMHAQDTLGVQNTAAVETIQKTEPVKPRFSLKPDSAFLTLSTKQRFFYGYNFDIYYHNDTRNSQKNNGWSVSVTPEFGYKFSQSALIGVRFGGSYSSTRSTYQMKLSEQTRDLRIQSGSWEVTPFARYRLKTLFNNKVGIWLETHLYAGMEFPRVTDGDVHGTDFDGLRHTITYGAQLSPVITYQFNSKSTFQIFFSILSFGYSGTTFCYSDEERGRYREYSNDLIIFSGKLRNLIANQFTPGLYGLKIGVQKSF